MQKAFVQIEPEKYAWPGRGEDAVGARDTAGGAGGKEGAAAGPAPAPPVTTKAGPKSKHKAPGGDRGQPEGSTSAQADGHNGKMLSAQKVGGARRKGRRGQQGQRVGPKQHAVNSFYYCPARPGPGGRVYGY